MITKIKIVLLTVLAVLVAALGMYNTGRKAGEKAEQLKQQKRVDDTRKVINDVEDRVNKLPGDDFSKRLYDKYRRD
jgi:uncharacterized protein YlxW (UPF0749 family)